MSAIEKQLWCAVIERALLDVAEPLSKRAIVRSEQELSRKWLTRPNSDFETVCSLAGIEPDNVRAAAIAMIEKATKHDAPRARPGKRRQRAQLSTVHHCNGRALTVTQWAVETGIRKDVIYKRLRRGLSIAEALQHRGVGQNFKNATNDRSIPVARDLTETGIL